jgi:hypothetical protein
MHMQDNYAKSATLVGAPSILGDVSYGPKTSKDPGLIDQLTSIAGRLNDLGTNLDALADRIGGPTPRDVPVAHGTIGGPAPAANIAACVLTINDLLYRAERETIRISSAL